MLGRVLSCWLRSEGVAPGGSDYGPASLQCREKGWAGGKEEQSGSRWREGHPGTQWARGLFPAQIPEATHFEEGLALLADVGHCEVGAGIAHDEGIFRQKAIPEQPPEGRSWL